MTSFVGRLARDTSDPERLWDGMADLDLEALDRILVVRMRSLKSTPPQTCKLLDYEVHR
jgi:hypothetical protein